MPEGRLSSPYQACKDVVIVKKDSYEKQKKQWLEFEKTCAKKIQIVDNETLTSFNALNEGINYINVANKVANKVIDNLDKSTKYAECSISCFAGMTSCDERFSEDKKRVNCVERISSIRSSMMEGARKIRMELALANESSGMFRLNIANVLSADKKNFINKEMRNFETGPNPFSKNDLSEYELREANKREESERKKLEAQFIESGSTRKGDWMAIKLMERFEKHQNKYRQIIFEEQPIFSVIEAADKQADPYNMSWSNEQILRAFKKLAENAAATRKHVLKSMANGKLEFTRVNAEATAKWATGENDLLHYMKMKNQVEEVLRSEPELCAAATKMDARLNTKELQNAGTIVAGSIATGGVVRGSSAVLTNLFSFGRALTAAEAAGFSGLAMGSVQLGDSFVDYNRVYNYAAARSGLDKANEGQAIVTAGDVKSARDSLEMSIVLAPLDGPAAFAFSKTLYNAMGKQMAKEIPGIADLAKKAKLDPGSRDLLIDKWLVEKIKTNLKSGLLSADEKAALESADAKKVLEKLVGQISAADPSFFKNPKNMDFVLKTAAATIKKEKNDPTDLAEKAKDLLLHFNTDAMSGAWDPAAQNNLLKVYSNAITELRLSAKNDPATYAKFSVDPDAQKKVLMSALKRSGVKSEDDALSMLQCAIPTK